ncbi:MAG: hypothetical protein IPL84_09285 [Chitinophagaceae bacterium]|nr:hypothetical protein [Chitinophagaceae bacterium]
MKLIIIPALTILLFSCSSAPGAKWDMATASKTCFDAASKGKYDLTDPEIKRLHGICDCVGEKMVATFKTEKEANEKCWMPQPLPMTVKKHGKKQYKIRK